MTKVDRSNTNNAAEAKKLLSQLPRQHVEALLNHFEGVVSKYQEGEWEASLSKCGKFVEAVAKALLVHSGQPLPPNRRFSVGASVTTLSKLSASGSDDTVRLTVPRACLFLYDITSNRGARHDPDKIDPNEMDASMATQLASWILAELIRYSSNTSTPEAASIVKKLSAKKYPYIEQMEGRRYVDRAGLAPGAIALLILDSIYPERISRGELSATVVRHGASKVAVATALTRLKPLVDDNNGTWQLRGIGRRKADEIKEAID